MYIKQKAAETEERERNTPQNKLKKNVCAGVII